ncbi:MAG: hypothetical protein A2504_09870 [Bdellovibrionales bacterium RIFOXYD12_FULL_39_22]|nr:MAG: hypothetical protein A2404_07155 [Bdellovibrionales bacterium RIFOXYC1_FULL_39_130]OFZ70474.1 MAG: hypothetical protein A2451_09700 [Bdellovibrionales bacterium RIFOXYC2_FULL_39_8]OFZ74494.1 MAG: hypothetical protein A2560_03955 [Bdellovibrionales bacterium RIFOXYD1_FULL_39_84]OFZ94274.1 MAG: hypothetical protein A2504_09870 [Bdellovibrionales bacterium RIFOXYD12_FULL_39_22]
MDWIGSALLYVITSNARVKPHDLVWDILLIFISTQSFGAVTQGFIECTLDRERVYNRASVLTPSDYALSNQSSVTIFNINGTDKQEIFHNDVIGTNLNNYLKQNAVNAKVFVTSAKIDSEGEVSFDVYYAHIAPVNEQSSDIGQFYTNYSTKLFNDESHEFFLTLNIDKEEEDLWCSMHSSLSDN